MELRALTPGLGVEVEGFDAALPGNAAELRKLLLEHAVVVARSQALSRVGLLALAREFGAPDIHPIARGTAEHPEVIDVHKPRGESASFGTGWHSDNSFFPAPSAVTILLAEVVPPVGGDTLFASMERAWEGLSEPLRRFVEPLEAVHSASSAYDPRTTGREKYEGQAAIQYTYSEAIYEEVVHPVVPRHPETGRQSLYVNPMFTQRIVGLQAHESRALLSLLYEHGTRPEFCCRVRWEPGTLVLWDNRAVQHYALDDYRDHERRMARVTISGSAPRR